MFVVILIIFVLSIFYLTLFYNEGVDDEAERQALLKSIRELTINNDNARRKISRDL